MVLDHVILGNYVLVKPQDILDITQGQDRVLHQGYPVSVGGV